MKRYLRWRSKYCICWFSCTFKYKQQRALLCFLLTPGFIWDLEVELTHAHNVGVWHSSNMCRLYLQLSSQSMSFYCQFLLVLANTQTHTHTPSVIPSPNIFSVPVNDLQRCRWRVYEHVYQSVCVITCELMSASADFPSNFHYSWRTASDSTCLWSHRRINSEVTLRQKQQYQLLFMPFIQRQTTLKIASWHNTVRYYSSHHWLLPLEG